MKSLVKKSLVAATALSLCACSSQSKESSTGDAAGNQNVSFTIWHTFTEAQQTLLETLANEYETAHPGVSIEVIGGYDPNSFESTVQDAVINGVGPQLVFNYASFATNFDGYDMLIDFGANWDIDLASMMAQGTYAEATGYSDSKIHSVPIQTTGPVLFYNKAIYDELGLTAPSTWDELKENCKIIYEQTGKVGLAVDSLQDLAQMFILQSHDGQYVDADNKKVLWNDEKTLQWVNWWADGDSLQDLAQMFILQSHDGQYVDADNKKVLWNDEKTLQWVNWWADGVAKGYFQVAPTTGDYNSSDLNAGALVSYIGSSAGLPYLDLSAINGEVLSAINGEVAVTRVPVIDENSKEVVNWNRSAIGFKKDDATDKVVTDFVKYFIEQDQRWVECLNAYSPYYAVQDSESDKVVTDFVKYFIEQDQRWVECLNAYSPYYAVQDSESYQAYVAKNIALAALGEQVNDGLVVPAFSGSIQMRDELKSLFASAADPNFDAKSALENAAKLSEAAMTE